MSYLPMLVSGVAVVSGCSALAVDHGVFYRLSRRLDSSIYRGCQDRRSVALTFDDGPGPHTPALLRFLDQRGIRGTFFQSGRQVQRHPEVAMLVHLGGHEIGNHGYSHKPLAPQLLRRPFLPNPFFVHKELSRTQATMREICGVTPRLFRAPFGQRWVGLDYLRGRLGLIGVQWTVIGHDWEWPAERVVPHVLERVGPGAIICLHDGPNEGGDIDINELLTGLDLMITSLRGQGYGFETVSELLQPTPAREHLSADPRSAGTFSGTNPIQSP